MAPAPFHSVSFKKKQKKTTRNKNKTQSSPLPIPVSWLSVDLFTVLMNILHGNNQPLHPRKLKFYTYHPQPQPQPQQQQHQNTKKNTEPNQKKNWWGLDFRLVTLTTPLTRWHYKQTNQQTNKQQTNQPTNRLLVRTAAKTKQQRVVWLIDWFFFWSLAKKKKARNRTAIVALSFPRSSFFFLLFIVRRCLLFSTSMLERTRASGPLGNFEERNQRKSHSRSSREDVERCFFYDCYIFFFNFS